MVAEKIFRLQAEGMLRGHPDHQFREVLAKGHQRDASRAAVDGLYDARAFKLQVE